MAASITRRALLAGAAVLCAVAPAACGSRQYETDARHVLDEARATIDSASALHFELSSDGATSTGSVHIVGGAGDAKRPDLFAGTFQVVYHGLPVSLPVVSSGGVFAVHLPFTPSFQRTDPGAYGFSDPGMLMSTSTGLSSLLSRATSATLADRDRLQGGELYEVDVTLPGTLVKQLLTDADPSKEVRGRIGIDVDSHQARRVVLTGPLLEAGHDTTYTVVLTGYGEGVAITPAPGV